MSTADAGPRRALPRATWLWSFVLCHLGTQLSIRFAFAPGTSLLYLPIPIGLALIHWWGPRVLPGLYLNALLCAGLWGLERWWLWPLYALPETVAVFSSWLLFTRLARGRCWLPDLRQTVLFAALGLAVPAVVDGLLVPGQLVLLGDIPAADFWYQASVEWLACTLASLTVALPLLVFATAALERRGWTVTRGAVQTPFLPPERRAPRFRLEVTLLVVAVALVGLAVPASNGWLVLGVMGLWAAARGGMGWALLMNGLTVFWTLLWPALLSSPEQGWQPAMSIPQYHLSLLTLSLASLFLGRATNDSLEHLRSRERAEAALRASEEKLRTIFEAMNDAVVVHDTITGAAVEVNPRALEMYGVPAGELQEVEIGALSLGEPPYDQEAAMAHIRRAVEQGPQLFEWHARDRAGRLFWVEVNMRHATIGGMSRVIVSVRDISDRKQAEADRLKLEEQLRQAHKMEAVGRLAGGIAHDFNNLLTVIGLNVSMARQGLPPGSRAIDLLDEVARATRSAGGLTKQLLAFSRRQVLERRVFVLNSVVLQIEKMLVRTIGEDIELVAELAPDLAPIRADVGQLEQVLLNLALNARDAMPDGGRLTIATANVPGDAVVTGARVRLTVRDGGVGMTDEVKAHLFEPFFTTKPPGQGTGLGLATVFGVVTQSDGTIEVESRPGEGASFHLFFPAHAAVEASRAPPPPAGARRGSETVLLVEDAAAVRRVAASILAELGYRVLECVGASDALELARRELERIDLLFTDVVMPGMNGRELAERFVELRPGVRVLYTSGHTDDARVLATIEAARGHFLQKPYSPESMAQKVREALDAS